MRTTGILDRPSSHFLVFRVLVSPLRAHLTMYLRKTIPALIPLHASRAYAAARKTFAMRIEKPPLNEFILDRSLYYALCAHHKNIIDFGLHYPNTRRQSARGLHISGFVTEFLPIYIDTFVMCVRL